MQVMLGPKYGCQRPLSVGMHGCTCLSDTSVVCAQVSMAKMVRWPATRTSSLNA